MRTGIAMHCGCRIFKMATKVEKNFPGYMLYISIDIAIFLESYPQLHKLILIKAFSVKEKKNNIPRYNLKTGARRFILYDHEI